MKFLIPLDDIAQVKILRAHCFVIECGMHFLRCASAGWQVWADLAPHLTHVAAMSIVPGFLFTIHSLRLLIWAELNHHRVWNQSLAFAVSMGYEVAPQNTESWIERIRYHVRRRFPVLFLSFRLFHCSTSTYLSERVYLRVCGPRLQILQLLQWEGGLVVWAFLIIC